MDRCKKDRERETLRERNAYFCNFSSPSRIREKLWNNYLRPLLLSQGILQDMGRLARADSHELKPK